MKMRFRVGSYALPERLDSDESWGVTDTRDLKFSEASSLVTRTGYFLVCSCAATRLHASPTK